MYRQKIILLLYLPLIYGLNTDKTFQKQINALKEIQKLDLIFLVDGSSSVGSFNFDSELNFVKKLLSDFTLSENKTQVSVIVFGTTAHVYENDDKCELLNTVLPTINYPGSNTNTLGAFLAARELVSSRNSTKIIFLVTDGFSNGGSPVPIAEELKYDYNVTIFTIAIRSGNIKELNEITSSDETIYLLESFAHFDLLARKALHSDLKDGEYIPVEDRKCGGCDHLARCTCGLSSGQYACRCKKGHYGSGKIGECEPCPSGTYHNYFSGICLPCPDVNHITNISSPATSVEECTCKKGYKKVKNGYQCEVMRCPKLKAPENGYFVRGDSCPNVLNNACGVRCNIGYSLRGNSIRLCRESGKWDGVEPQCHLKTCPKPPVPAGGEVSCVNSDLDIIYKELPEDMPVDTECGFKCSSGYSLIGSQRRTCLPVEQWDGLRTTCKPMRCIRLQKIPHGKALPENCAKEKQKHGSKCKIECEKGYSGPGEIECITKGRHGAWSAKPRCIDTQAPEIRCPEDIRTYTEKNSSYSLVNWKAPQVSDNSKQPINVWFEPSEEEEEDEGPYKIEIGSNLITYYAVDSSGNSASCNFTVHVIDNEAPQFICENPPPYLVGDGNVTIEWDEPQVTDNSDGDIVIQKSKEFGTLPIGINSITYTAIDGFNNSNSCVINVTVQLSTCEDTMPDIARSCNEVPDGVLCVLTCEEGYAFPVTDKASCDNNLPIWSIPECTPTEIPEILSGEIEKSDCPKLEENCKDDCEILDCGEDNRIKRNTDTKTRFRVKISKPEEVENRFKGVPISGLKPVCRNGTIPARSKKLRCVRCGRGTFHNGTKCEPCPVDMYNDRTGQVSCHKCPEGRYTRNRKGSKTQRACKVRLGNRFRPVVRKEPCKNDTCHRGTCISVGTSRHKCKCSEGWIGARCKIRRINYCANEPCLNSGSCTQNLTGYKCSCPTGFLGDSCELEALEDEPAPQINFCAQVPNLCENGATCQSEDGGYRCICPPGFMGRRCQIVPCDYHPCPLKKICRNLENGKTDKMSFKCDCPKGKTGENCTEIDELCGCQNNGTCQDDGNCICPKKFAGANCTEEIKSDFVLHFPNSGVSDYAILQVPKIDLKDLTMCTWVETNNTFNYGTILSYANNFDNAFTLIDYSGLVLWVNGKFVVTNVKINDGFWHHLCVSWTSGSGDYTIYIDSQPKAHGNGLSKDKPISGGGILVIGQEQDFQGGGFSRSESYIGKITYLDIWSKKLDNIGHDCNKYEGGDFVSWIEFRNNVKGSTKILDSEFCKECKRPIEEIQNGKFMVSEDGSELILNCSKGYVVRLEGQYPLTVSSLSRKCTASGRWENQDINLFCVKIQCNYPPRISNAKISSRRKRVYRFEDQVTYQCLEGYEMNGNATKICEENGVWTEEKLECIGVHCTPFPLSSDANITVLSEHVYDENFEEISRFEVGSVIEVSCSEQTSILTCLDNRTWEGLPPTCKKPVTGCEGVDAPPIPDNGYLTESEFENTTLYDKGTMFSYKCRTGYEIFGVNFTICQDDGWSKPNVTCQPIKCPHPPKYMNMHPKKQQGVSTFHYGNIVYYECDLGFSFYGNNIIRCQVNGKWSRVRGKCARISCGKPTEIAEDETIIGSSYLYKDSLHIMCPKEAARDYYEAKCTHMGQWLYSGNCHTPKEAEKKEIQ